MRSIKFDELQPKAGLPRPVTAQIQTPSPVGVPKQMDRPGVPQPPPPLRHDPDPKASIK